MQLLWTSKTDSAGCAVVIRLQIAGLCKKYVSACDFALMSVAQKQPTWCMIEEGIACMSKLVKEEDPRHSAHGNEVVTV